MSFQTTLKLNPCHVPALCNFGALLHHAGNYQGSESMYLKAISIDNNCNQAWCNLGALQALRKDFANAEHSYNAAMSIDPTHETTLYNYGILKAEQRLVEAAEGMLMRYVLLLLLVFFPDAKTSSTPQRRACVEDEG